MAETSAPNDPMSWGPPRADAVRVVLVRHGRTSWNATGRFLGRTDIGLDEDGARGAEELGLRLRGRFDAVWSSPLCRALDTARALHPEPTLLPGVAELDQGVLEGLTAKEAMAAHPAFFAAFNEDPTEICVPGGESMGALARRALQAVLALSAAPGSTIAVVTHQVVIAALQCHVEGVPLSAWRRHTVPNLALVPLELCGGALLRPGPPG